MISKTIGGAQPAARTRRRCAIVKLPDAVLAARASEAARWVTGRTIIVDGGNV